MLQLSSVTAKNMVAQNQRRRNLPFGAKGIKMEYNMIIYKHISKTFGIVCLMLIMFSFSISYGDLVLNQDFDTNLGGWFTAFENPMSTTSSYGTVEWSPAFDGSAHLTVSGAPGVADLITGISTTIYPGDKIICKVTTSSMTNAGVHLYIGDYFNDINQRVDIYNRENSTFDMQLIADKTYEAGTSILIHLACWPGSGEVWIHNLDLIRSER